MRYFLEQLLMYQVACVTSAFHELVTRVTCSVENLQAKLSKASELGIRTTWFREVQEQIETRCSLNSAELFTRRNLVRLLNLQGIERRGHRKPRLERYKVCNFKFVDKNIHPIDIGFVQSANHLFTFSSSSTMSVSDNDSDVSEDGISMKIDSKGSKDCNVSNKMRHTSVAKCYMRSQCFQY